MKSFLKCASTLALVPLLFWGLVSCGGGGGTSLTVNNSNDVDDGNCDAAHCSLREAIKKANTLSGSVTILFNIPGGGVHTIQPTSALPATTGTVVIDGSSQPGFFISPLIELDGSLAGGGTVDGLVINGGGSTVKSLVIIRFSGYGIRLGFPEENSVQGCYIGTDVTGMGAAGNTLGGVVVVGNNDAVGGTTPNSGNVISGNLGDGVVVIGVRNSVQGNRIGTNAAGTAALANQGNGVTVDGNINIIGGTSANAKNIISGNHGNGVRIHSDSVLVQGNYIGTNLSGTGAIGNQGNGVDIFGVGSVQVGGSESGAMNVISANQQFGVLTEEDSNSASVYGNRIGTDKTGTSALGNIKGGVRVGGTNHQIGASFQGARNLISGNGGPGIAVLSTSTGDKIQNNYIGTTLDGKAALGNGMGIEVGLGAGNTNVLIGGNPYSDGNLISGNDAEGVLLYTGATVQGNIIGADDTGLAALGNGGNGILIKGPGNYIGGTGFFNRIAFNAGNGVAVISESGGATGNFIVANSIHDNGGLGIAISENTVIPNDTQDPDTGDNNRQNYPNLVSAVTDPVAIDTTFTGTLNSAPGTVYTVEFYTNAACDPSGFGEGHRLVKTITVTTNVSGQASLSAYFSSTVFDTGNYITATATDPGGNTSEFSNCIQVTEAVTPTETYTPTFTFTPTSISGGLDFKPSVYPSQLYYGECGPEQVDISVEISGAPKEIAYVLLFARLMDPATGNRAVWTTGLSMGELGKNKFLYHLQVMELTDYEKFMTGVVQYEFVAYAKGEEKLGTSDIFGDIAFSNCRAPGGARMATSTPTPRLGTRP